MTLLVAVRAADGLAVPSDRKEAYLHGPPKNVKKYHLDKRERFYIPLAGDGKLAEGAQRCLARARTGPADVLARLRSIAKALHARPQRTSLRVDGLMVVADRQSPVLYSIGITGGSVDAHESRDGVPVHGDGRAQALRRHITKKAGLMGMPCEGAARHLHMLASDMAEHVESVGERGTYGFDLALFAAAGVEKVLERGTERHGWIDVSFRPVGRAGPPAARGGGAA